MKQSKKRLVSVSIIFSKNDKFGSHLIRIFTDQFNDTLYQTPSHVALLIENRWVFESTAEKGIVITPFEKWSENNTACLIKFLGQVEYAHLKALYRRLEGCKYDWPGVIYLALFVLLNRLFKTSIPAKNCLESRNKYFCTEVIEELIKKDLSMTTPVELMLDIIENKVQL